MKLIPSFPKVGKIPPYPASPTSVNFTIATAVLLTLLYAVFGNAIIAGAAFIMILLHIAIAKQVVHINKFALWTLLITLLIASIGLLVVLFGGYTGRQSSLALLMLLLGLKLLETKDTRGYAVACIIMYFLVAALFAYESSSIVLPILLIFCLLITTSLALLSQPSLAKQNYTPTQNKTTAVKTNSLPTSANTSKIAPKQPWVRSALFDNSKIILKAIPLAMILFFLFPRIQGNFGFLPVEDSGKPGLDNVMRAGDFAERAFSNELAFRAEFSSKIPPNDQLYWRSNVFSLESQFNWGVDFTALDQNPLVNTAVQQPQTAIGNANSANNDLNNKPNQVLSSDDLTHYKIVHQPSRDTNLPVLEYIETGSLGRIFQDNTLRLKKSLNGTTEYQATAQPGYSTAHLSKIQRPRDIERYLHTSILPKTKTKALLTQWRTTAKSDEALVNTILRHFREQPFKYNLLPPEVSRRQPVEDFLFDTRSGYCEHYASVFSLLMRWSNIPSRVIVGYQGGDWIAEGGFLEVRYSDAHAWNEVWLDDQGWVRVDPTFAVAPERIEFGMDALFALWERNEIGSGLTARKLADMLKPRGVNRAWLKMNKLYSSFSHRWDKWIVNFNHRRQLELLKKLSLGDGNYHLKLLLLMFAASGIVIGIFLYRMMPQKTPLSAVDKEYRLFLKKLAKANLKPASAEGPMDFAQRITQHLPTDKADIMQITTYYIQSKYDYRQHNIASLRNAVKHFKLSKKNSKQHSTA